METLLDRSIYFWYFGQCLSRVCCECYRPRRAQKKYFERYLQFFRSREPWNEEQRKTEELKTSNRRSVRRGWISPQGPFSSYRNSALARELLMQTDKPNQANTRQAFLLTGALFLPRTIRPCVAVDGQRLSSWTCSLLLQNGETV